ncbi:NAD(P)-binding protein [Phenylobacterium sp. LjRoot219]|uniref:NAD(P)-binding protein n=1 Tax=Phenylobacterium sp. LjRoot219 TaxID=3342283 RepID=UPI003ED08386
MTTKRTSAGVRDRPAKPAAVRAEPSTAYDAIILGAGISGLVASSVLLQQGCKRLLVLDDYEHIGGNHIDRAIGPYTFDVGSFIFQDDSPLLRHFPELLPQYVPINPSWGRLNPQGVVTRYPISFKTDLIDAGPIEWCRILASVAWARVGRRKLASAWDFAQYWAGAHLLHRSGLARYMERFYGVAPSQIDLRFAEKRMLWIKEHGRLRTHIRRIGKPKGRTNTQLARPRSGFSELYRPAAERLEARGVKFRLGADIRSVRRDGATFVVETATAQHTAPRLLSTIPLEMLQRLCGLEADPGLQTVTLMSLFFSFSGRRGFDQSVLYNFSNQGAWKRLTVYSDFYGRSGGREFFAAEVNAHNVDGSVAAAEQDFRAHAAANGLFHGDLRLEGSHTLPHAYPIYTGNAYDKVDATVARLKELGIETLGRQGLFDYQPTARDTTLKAEAALGARP